MADEFGNYIVRGHREPTYITNARQILAQEQNYALMSPENRVYVKQGLRLLYYCMTHFVPGVESALREGADPNYTQRGQNDFNDAVTLLMTGSVGFAEDRIHILRLLFEHGFKPRGISINDTNISLLQRALNLAVHLAEPTDDDDNDNIDAIENTLEVINIKKRIASIILKHLPITKAEIEGANMMSRLNKELCLNLLRKREFLPQFRASQQLDILRSGIQTPSNPFHAQGTRDTVMDFATGKRYLSKEQRSALMGNTPRGGKRFGKTCKKCLQKTRKHKVRK